MKVSEYDNFVSNTDQAAHRPIDARLNIAILGLASEIGSLLGAIKKKLLNEDGAQAWNVPNDEIVDELGDILWYGFSLARISNPKRPMNILAQDIRNLQTEIQSSGPRGERIRAIINQGKRDEFLVRAKEFPKSARTMTLDDYQAIAFLTARTGDKVLIEVCLIVLWQLSAQILRTRLPDIEMELNTAVSNQPLNNLLGEVAWHIAAISSLYGLGLGEVARRNMKKVAYRQKGLPTPLHDEHAIETQKFPRKFEIAFVSVQLNRCRMYFNGSRLGDELTDNSYEDDGYRYHDIMHLANVAKLGWSPVLRSLMGKKRKADPRSDEVEDGARAQIVEEAVIKTIHSVGISALALHSPSGPSSPYRLFSQQSDITFSFLKMLNSLVQGLEAERNRYWEWEEAIRSGHEIFYQLRLHGQGTVCIDLDNRSIAFSPAIDIQLNKGGVVGLGVATEAMRVSPSDPEQIREKRARVLRLGIANSLGLSSEVICDLDVSESINGGVKISASGAVRTAMWQRGVISFKASITTFENHTLQCTVIALGD